MLHADPQLVHLGEVLQQKVQRVVHVPPLSLVLGPRVGQQAPADLAKVAAQEEPTGGVLHLGEIQDICEYTDFNADRIFL